MQVTLAQRLTLLFAPIRAAGRAALIDTAVLSLTAVLILTGGGLWLAAGFGLLVQVFGVLGALVLGGVGLWTLALLLLLVRLMLRRGGAGHMQPDGAAPGLAAPGAPTSDPAAPDPLPQLVFDLFFMAGQAMPRKRG